MALNPVSVCVCNERFCVQKQTLVGALLVFFREQIKNQGWFFHRTEGDRFDILDIDSLELLMTDLLDCEWKSQSAQSEQNKSKCV